MMNYNDVYINVPTQNEKWIKTVDYLKPKLCFELERSLKTLRKLGLTNGMLSEIF